MIQFHTYFCLCLQDNANHLGQRQKETRFFCLNFIGCSSHKLNSCKIGNLWVICCGLEFYGHRAKVIMEAHKFYVVVCHSGWNEDSEGLLEIARIFLAISLRQYYLGTELSLKYICAGPSHVVSPLYLIASSFKL